MLVDLARNDVNRVCQPTTVKVDRLMEVEKFSHVIHMTSQVSGVLREGLTRYLCSPISFAQTDAIWVCQV
jgi:anthranilate synthase component I